MARIATTPVFLRTLLRRVPRCRR